MTSSTSLRFQQELDRIAQRRALFEQRQRSWTDRLAQRRVLVERVYETVFLARRPRIALLALLVYAGMVWSLAGSMSSPLRFGITAFALWSCIEYAYRIGAWQSTNTIALFRRFEKRIEEVCLK